MKEKLRSYQQECINSIEDNFKKTTKQLIQLPTGAGKTIVFLSYIGRHSKKCLITCPTKDIQNQIINKSNEMFGRESSSIDLNNKIAKYFVLTSACLNYNLSQIMITDQELDFYNILKT